MFLKYFWFFLHEHTSKHAGILYTPSLDTMDCGMLRMKEQRATITAWAWTKSHPRQSTWERQGEQSRTAQYFTPHLSNQFQELPKFVWYLIDNRISHTSWVHRILYETLCWANYPIIVDFWNTCPTFPKYQMVTNPQVRSNSSYCLVNGKQYYQGESFGSTCNRCTCYLYGAVYVDCVKASDCKERGTYDTEKGDTQTSNPAIRGYNITACCTDNRISCT